MYGLVKIYAVFVNIIFVTTKTVNVRNLKSERIQNHAEPNGNFIDEPEPERTDHCHYRYDVSLRMMQCHYGREV